VLVLTISDIVIDLTPVTELANELSGIVDSRCANWQVQHVNAFAGGRGTARQRHFYTRIQIIVRLVRFLLGGDQERLEITRVVNSVNCGFRL